MSQLNLHMTVAFEQELKKLMQVKAIKTKSEAIRMAVKESLERATYQNKKFDFSKWQGLATQTPINPNPRFSSDDELWEK